MESALAFVLFGLVIGLGYFDIAFIGHSLFGIGLFIIGARLADSNGIIDKPKAKSTSEE